ncbi:cytochrome P450 [Phyllosticta citrichinensis]
MVCSRMLLGEFCSCLSGPIIRITPDELHIQDSAYHETMYSPNRPFNKPEKIAHRFENPLSAFATPDHAKHHQRRSALNPFFSKKKVAQFSPEIQMSMQKILARLEQEYVGTGRVLSLNRMWGCLSSDTIVAFAFERHYDFVESPEFHSALNRAMIDLLEPNHWLVNVPLVARIFQLLPDSAVRYLQPQMDSVIHLNTTFQTGTLQYRNWTIPAGTMVSMDTYAVCHDEEIFPDSFSFIPERWLGNPKAPDGQQLSRYMVSFGQGTPSCTGIQLGYAKLYIGLANFFR